MKIPEELEPVVEWWEMHGKEAVVVVVVAALVAVGIGAYNMRKRSRHDAASDALASAVNASLVAQFDASSPAALQSVQDIRAAIETQPAAKTTPVMKLLLASASFASREEAGVKGALGIYEELMASGKTPAVYADIPKVGRAQCLEALGRFPEALAAFDEFAAENPKSLLALTAKLGAARSLAQDGRKDEAIARLEALKKEVKDIDLQAVEFTLAIVKRWVPADKRIPAPPPVEPKAAVEAAIDDLAAPATNAAPAAAPAPAANPVPAQEAGPAPEAKAPAAPAAPAAEPDRKQ